MNKRHLLILCALVFFCAGAPARADEASSTPPVLPEEAAASTTPPAAPSEETSSTTPEALVPAPDPVSIVLDIETADTTLFNGPVAVSACSPKDGQDSKITGYCALEQSGVAAAWSWWGDDAFLDSLGGAANDSAAGAYWMWFKDLEMGGTALNKHALAEGESLLVTLGTMPLRLELEAHPAVNSTSTITVLAFGFDENYNPVWLPAADASVRVGSQSFVADASGQVLYTASTTDPFEAYASKDGYVPTSRSTITPVALATLPAPEEAPAKSGGGAKKRSTGAAEALSFLLAQQRADGSFGNIMQSDWAALALAAGGAPRGAKDALGDYLASAKKLSSLTDYERHAMALEALDISPYEANAIQKIVAGFDGAQMGDPELLNDDIFALLPLLHAGYKASDDIIIKIASHIVSSQDADGSWRYQDITSAAIQALAPLSSLNGVSAALAKAVRYLKARQQEDGCFGNIYSHSWALQAALMPDEPAEYWRTAQGATPLDCLDGLQQEDGGFEHTAADMQNRIWATAYAIPALAGKPWDTLLKNFPKPKGSASRTPASGAPASGIVLGAATTAAPLATTTQNQPPIALPPEKPEIVPAQIATPKKPVPDTPASAREEPARNQAAAAVPALPHKPVIGFLLSLWQSFASLLWFI